MRVCVYARICVYVSVCAYEHTRSHEYMYAHITMHDAFNTFLRDYRLFVILIGWVLYIFIFTTFILLMCFIPMFIIFTLVVPKMYPWQVRNDFNKDIGFSTCSAIQNATSEIHTYVCVCVCVVCVCVCCVCVYFRCSILYSRAEHVLKSISRVNLHGVKIDDHISPNYHISSSRLRRITKPIWPLKLVSPYTTRILLPIVLRTVQFGIFVANGFYVCRKC